MYNESPLDIVKKISISVHDQIIPRAEMRVARYTTRTYGEVRKKTEIKTYHPPLGISFCETTAQPATRVEEGVNAFATGTPFGGESFYGSPPPPNFSFDGIARFETPAPGRVA